MLSSILTRNKLKGASPTSAVFDRFCSALHYDAVGGELMLMSGIRCREQKRIQQGYLWIDR